MGVPEPQVISVIMQKNIIIIIYIYDSKIIYLVNETTHSRTGRQHEKNVRKHQEVSLVFLLRSRISQ